MALILTRDEYNHGVRGAAFLMEALGYRSREQLLLHLAGLDDEQLERLVTAAMDATKEKGMKTKINELSEQEVARRVYDRLCHTMGARSRHPDEVATCVSGWTDDEKFALVRRLAAEVQSEIEGENAR